jgi:2-iminoacetate synthase
MYVESKSSFIKEDKIEDILRSTARVDPSEIREILSKAKELRGLTEREVALLTRVNDPEITKEIFSIAREIKEEIYGSRIVLFAPLYVSNICANECSYCAFRVKNKEINRRYLSQEEIAEEVLALVNQGHKRLLLVAGEAYPKGDFDYVIQSIRTIYRTKSGNGEIRRVNVNLAPLTVDEFRRVKAEEIGTYQLFQETYHRKTYTSVHLSGPKKDYDWRLTAMDRAMEAGIDDVGIGVLFGLYDWRFELLAMMQHIAHLEERFGVGPHTISVPRLEPALGSKTASSPPYAVSDEDFYKLVAIIRMAVPYTGMVMSTRESPLVRRETFKLGISQISAGSRTDPGGYSRKGNGSDNDQVQLNGQFQLGDHRSVDEVVHDLSKLGYVPSFCTACYRLGRTGQDFMDLARPGDIKYHCCPNALSTFLEYLTDYGSDSTKEVGEQVIQDQLSSMDKYQISIASDLLKNVREGKRDQFV